MYTFSEQKKVKKTQQQNRTETVYWMYSILNDGLSFGDKSHNTQIGMNMNGKLNVFKLAQKVINMIKQHRPDEWRSTIICDKHIYWKFISERWKMYFCLQESNRDCAVRRWQNERK